MNILFISNDPTFVDAQSPVRGRFREYARFVSGEVHVLTATPRAVEQQDGNIFIHGVRTNRLMRIWTLARRGRNIILTHNIGVVSAQDPFEHGLAALRAIEGTQAKLHVQVHTDFLSPWFTRSGNWRSPKVRMPLLNRYRVRIADRVLPQAHGIRVVSKRISDSLLARYGARIPEPAVIPVPLEGNVPPRVALPPHPFTFALITVGRLEPEKRIEDILHALARVAHNYPQIGLIICGEGREKTRLRALTKKLGLATRVVFLGNRSDAWGFMQSAQAYIQASAYEGYSRTLLEAALAKVPIITTDVGIVGEVFKGYEDVLAVPWPTRRRFPMQ